MREEEISGSRDSSLYVYLKKEEILNLVEIDEEMLNKVIEKNPEIVESAEDGVFYNLYGVIISYIEEKDSKLPSLFDNVIEKYLSGLVGDNSNESSIDLALKRMKLVLGSIQKKHAELKLEAFYETYIKTTLARQACGRLIRDMGRTVQKYIFSIPKQLEAALTEDEQNRIMENIHKSIINDFEVYLKAAQEAIKLKSTKSTAESLNRDIVKE